MDEMNLVHRVLRDATRKMTDDELLDATGLEPDALATALDGLLLRKLVRCDSFDPPGEGGQYGWVGHAWTPLWEASAEETDSEVKNVTGTWAGEYTYGPVYGFLEDYSVPFTMSLSQSRLGVTGHVRDDPSHGGMPERGRIEGSCKKSRLRFIKFMPHHYVLVDGGLADYRTWFESTHGVRISADLPPLRIQYAGDLTDSGLSMSGTWKIIRDLVDSDRGRIRLGSGEYTGTWTAKRVSDDDSEVPHAAERRHR